MSLVNFKFYYFFSFSLLFILLASSFVPVLSAQVLDTGNVPENQGSFGFSKGSSTGISSKISIKSLLQQFVKNGSRQLFDGTFVYFFEDKVQTVKVHRKMNENGVVVEEFIPMDSEQKKSTRILKNEYCSLNNDWQYQFQAFSSSFPFRVNNFYEQLQQYYDFSITDLETVAGIPAIGLIIKSKDPYRYGYHLWFEPQTATLLKYKLIDQKGKLIEQYLFTDITIQSDAKSKQYLPSLSQSSACRQQFQGMTKAFQQYFLTNKIPVGYELVSFRKGYISGGERQAFQFQLSDGLSTVSIFIEESKESGKSINGVLQLGPVNVTGKSFEKYQMTIIGAIPIASGLHFIQAAKPLDHELSFLKQNGQ